jgi:hypothetical protein
VLESGLQKPPQPLYEGGRAALLAWVASVTIAIDGFVLVLAGPGALLPPTASYVALPWYLLLASGLGAGLLLWVRGRSLFATLRSDAPRLYPLAPTWLHALLYVAILLGATAVFLGLFDIFSAAHSNGNTAQISSPNAANLLIGLGSLLLWMLALYAALVVLRSIRMGQLIAARKGTDAYGLRIAPEGAGPVRLLPGAHQSPPQAAGGRRVLYVVSIVLMFGMSVAIQASEVNSSPAPPIEWAWAQLFLPLWAALIAGGLWTMDRGIRSLERNYVAVVGRRVPSPPIPSETTPRF